MDQSAPASFGDSLAQIERFIIDVRERTGPDEPLRPWLFGYAAGATLSLAAIGVLADLIAGVISVCGPLPDVRDWQVLHGTAEGLPILLILDPGDPLVSPELVRQSHDALQQWGASATHQEIAGARDLGADVSVTARDWLRNQILSRQGTDHVTG